MKDISDQSPKQQIHRLNLVRLWWLNLTTTSITALLCVSDLFFVQDGQAANLLVVTTDLGLSVFFLVLCHLARKGKLSERFSHILPVAYATFFLAILDAYYFALPMELGRTNAYLFGVLAPAVVLFIPRPIYMTLLGVNLLLCAGTLWPTNAETSGKVVETTMLVGATVLAALANSFLWQWKTREIAHDLAMEEQNAQLTQANERLLERNREVDELMAITTHDLRSPLEAMRMLSEMQLEEAAWQASPYRETMESFLGSSGRMLELVNNLLIAHHSEQQENATALEATDLFDAVAATMEHVRPKAETKQIQLEFTGPEEQVFALAEAEGLSRILENLLSNAIKFAPMGSQVSLRVEEETTGPKIEVIDEGPGISESEQERLFQKFHRGSNTPTGGETSSGLGLFIAYNLASNMSGELTYRRRHPQGSIFTLRLNAAAE